MPAARGLKRGAKTLAAEPKKARTDPGLVGVLEGIEKAADLPESCRALLTAVAPTCFASAEEGEQQPHQATIVSWIGDVLDGLRAKLQDAVDEANTLASDGDTAKKGLDGKISEAQGAFVAAMEAVVAAKDGVEEASKAVAAAAAGLSEAQEAQGKATGIVEKLTSERQALEAAMSDDQLDRVDLLLPIAKSVGLDESLLLALPKACEKPADARGPFDMAVLEQVGAGIAQKVDSLDAELEAATSAEGDAKKAAEAAQAGVESAEQAKQAAVDHLESAEQQKVQAHAALAEAEAALEAFTQERAPQEKARQEKVVALADFTSYNLESFRVLQAKAAASAGA